MQEISFKYSQFVIGLLIFVFSYSTLFAQEKDSVKNSYVWVLEEGYIPQEVEFDTLINQFHTYNPIEKNSFSNSFLGNIGAEYNSNIFMDELGKPHSDFLHEKPFDAYLLTPDNQKFYFTKRPYIELKYTMSTKKWNENNLGVLYTQNINKKLNIGLLYDLISADGVFPRSKTSKHSMSFFTSYTGDKYSIHAAVLRNKIKLQESGGILSSTVTDPDLSLPQINNASSILYKSNFFISQEYKFGKDVVKIIDDTLKQTVYTERGKLNYILNYEHNYRLHFDDDDLSGFYDSIYISPNWTTDSVSLKLLDNTLSWTFREMKVGDAIMMNSFGAGYQILNNYNFKGYIVINDGDNYNSLSAHFNSIGTFNKFRYKLKTKYFIQGYKSADYLGTFDLEKDFVLKQSLSTLNLNLEVSNRTPSFFEQYYYSNHFLWDNNDFNKKNTAKLKFGFSIPKKELNIELAYAQLNNYIYFDSLAPRQLETTLGVLSVKGQKEFKLGKFHSLNKIVWQLADNTEAVSIPEVVLYNNLYLDLQYKKAAHLHVGYELYYSTEFYALSFMPATGQFYQDRDGISGGFAIINIFADIRIQSVLLFMKFENVGFQFFNSDYYYLANNYPLNPTIFKFGVSWRFKD